MKWMYIVIGLIVILIVGSVVERYSNNVERQSIHLGAQP
jgi:uncharacterized membrane-anchored protein YhcB (DUF1043 family)